MQPSYSTIVTRMNESSGSVVVVPAAVLFQPRICRVEMIEWEEGPDKGTDQKSLTPCWKRRRGGWLNSPLLLSKLIEGNIIGDSDKAAIQEWRPADQGKEWRQLLKGEGEEENRRLVDPFDLLMGKDKYESIGQGGVEKGVDDGPSWDESGRIEASPLGQVWAGTKGAVGLSEKKEPLCERVRSKEEENKSLLGQGWAGFMETTERLKRKVDDETSWDCWIGVWLSQSTWAPARVPVEAQSDLNQGIIVGEDFKDSFHLLGNLLVIYFCNGFKS
ncbi:hypothetical protein BY996DRAFT_6466512 [Phakopsora pachyrhizi]|nr:hypothetical protein BY996DRAFT_6466512 [Phakopsora pachyrhizi]